MGRLSHSIFQIGCSHIKAGRIFEADPALREGAILDAFERAQWDRPAINAPCYGPPCGDCGSPAAHANSVLIAVDGACRRNGRSDATAACAVFFSKDSPYNEAHVLPGDASTPATSQRAELMGAIKALEAARRLVDGPEEAGLAQPQQIVIKTDSAYLVHGATEWIDKWTGRGWKTAKGTPVANRDLFQRLEDRIQALEHMDIVVQFLRVPRRQNREADAAANRALDELARRAPLAAPQAGGGLRISPALAIGACEQLGRGGARPEVDILSLDGLPWTEEMYGDLLNALGGCAHVRHVSTATAALERLAVATKPTAVLVVDAGITQKEGRDVMATLAEYVAAGGTAIFCCAFSSFVRFSDVNRLFRSHFGLSWEAGSYTRSTSRINPPAIEALPSERRLPSTCSQKALHLRGVGYHSALYLSDDFGCRGQTPAAWARVGRGGVGYVGDVNAEKEMDSVILAMCGL